MPFPLWWATIGNPRRDVVPEYRVGQVVEAYVGLKSGQWNVLYDVALPWPTAVLHWDGSAPEVMPNTPPVWRVQVVVEMAQHGERHRRSDRSLVPVSYTVKLLSARATTWPGAWEEITVDRQEGARFEGPLRVGSRYWCIVRWTSSPSGGFWRCDGLDEAVVAQGRTITWTNASALPPNPAVGDTREVEFTTVERTHGVVHITPDGDFYGVFVSVPHWTATLTDVRAAPP